jgi:LuxR family transcriptional regulator, quorum-sensing system regulator SdiA
MMSKEISVVKQVAACLERLSGYCDTGYLLAVHIRYTRPSLLFKTYPQDWLDRYSEAGMMMVDPVVRWGMTHEGTALWDDLAGDDPAGVIAAARTFGLSHGLSFAIGPATSRTIGSVTRSSVFTPAEVDDMRVIVTDIHGLTDGLEQLPPKVQEGLRNLG